jgi:hypothetical protein
VVVCNPLPEWLPSKLVSWDGTVHGKDELPLNGGLSGELSSVGYDNDDGRLQVERVAALPVHVDAGLHPVNVENVENLKIINHFFKLLTN